MYTNTYIEITNGFTCSVSHKERNLSTAMMDELYIRKLFMLFHRPKTVIQVSIFFLDRKISMFMSIYNHTLFENYRETFLCT